MTEASTNSDISSRGLAIFFAIALGLVYIILVGEFVPHFDNRMLKVWAIFPAAQFLYIAPAAYWCRSEGRLRAMQGWLVGAAAAAIVYAPCWGLALVGSSTKF